MSRILDEYPKWFIDDDGSTDPATIQRFVEMYSINNLMPEIKKRYPNTEFPEPTGVLDPAYSSSYNQFLIYLFGDQMDEDRNVDREQVIEAFIPYVPMIKHDEYTRSILGRDIHKLDDRTIAAKVADFKIEVELPIFRRYAE